VTRRLLDLFCKAGGATRGYQLAGFHVTGVDIEPQPHYIGDDFIQADALTFPLDGFDAVHASPVCKLWSQATRTAVDPSIHPDQIAPTRERLSEWGGAYVIENVPEAPLIDPTLLCGSMFDLDVRRHRNFETNWPLADHYWPCRHGIWGRRFHPARSDRKQNGALARVITVAGHGNDGAGGRVADWRRAMGIDWMTRDELAQAIPPAYTEFIGRQLMALLDDREPAA
jgi:DNA (cytosine-5)-methyltransferase 1